jgi:SCA7, zinc-binding domain
MARLRRDSLPPASPSPESMVSAEEYQRDMARLRRDSLHRLTTHYRRPSPPASPSTESVVSAEEYQREMARLRRHPSRRYTTHYRQRNPPASSPLESVGSAEEHWRGRTRPGPPQRQTFYGNNLAIQNVGANQSQQKTFYPPNKSFNNFPQSTSMAPPMIHDNSMGAAGFGQQSPVTPAFTMPSQQIMRTPAMGQQQTDPAASMPSRNGALFDPSDPTFFNFDLASLNFGNNYGALKFGTSPVLPLPAGYVPGSFPEGSYDHGHYPQLGARAGHINWPPVDVDALSNDEGDRRAADPTTDHNVMFVTHTISQDRTGNQESITRKRLAALGARCVLRMSRPEVEELLVTPKPKKQVDVEKQCGVLLPNGRPCARSLTCNRHSMGAKRAVPGRSRPYDMLLQAYQKQNQAKGRMYPGMHAQQAAQAKAQQARQQQQQ